MTPETDDRIAGLQLQAGGVLRPAHPESHFAAHARTPGSGAGGLVRGLADGRRRRPSDERPGPARGGRLRALGGQAALRAGPRWHLAQDDDHTRGPRPRPCRETACRWPKGPRYTAPCPHWCRRKPLLSRSSSGSTGSPFDSHAASGLPSLRMKVVPDPVGRSLTPESTLTGPRDGLPRRGRTAGLSIPAMSSWPSKIAPS